MGNEFKLKRRAKCLYCGIDSAAIGDLKALINQQAEDEGLWSVPAEGLQPIGEAYLQQELRKLHAAAEATFQVTQHE